MSPTPPTSTPRQSPTARPVLTLAHSGDPDDAFMWWPITGRVKPNGEPYPGVAGQPAIGTGRFTYRAIPGDIAAFNALAANESKGAGPTCYDVCALSARAWATVSHLYAITEVGSSMGEGYGPKLVMKPIPSNPTPTATQLLDPNCRIAVPGLTTSAVLTLDLWAIAHGSKPISQQTTPTGQPRLVPASFNDIIPLTVRGEVTAGLVIHEGQLTYKDANLFKVLDLGGWWTATHALPLPLGVNAVRLDLDQRFGPGSVQHVANTLRASLTHALKHRAASTAYTMPYARVNALQNGTPPPSLATVQRYLGMYVTHHTSTLSPRARQGLSTFFDLAAKHGLIPARPTLSIV